MIPTRFCFCLVHNVDRQIVESFNFARGFLCERDYDRNDCNINTEEIPLGYSQPPPSHTDVMSGRVGNRLVTVVSSTEMFPDVSDSQKWSIDYEIPSLVDASEGAAVALSIQETHRPDRISSKPGENVLGLKMRLRAKRDRSRSPNMAKMFTSK